MTAILPAARTVVVFGVILQLAGFAKLLVIAVYSVKKHWGAAQTKCFMRCETATIQSCFAVNFAASL
jgi:hypothetical protein